SRWFTRTVHSDEAPPPPRIRRSHACRGRGAAALFLARADVRGSRSLARRLFFALFLVLGAIVHTVHRIHRHSTSRAGAQILALRSTLTPSNTLPQRMQRTGRPGLQSRLQARPSRCARCRVSVRASLVQRSRPAAVRLVRVRQPCPCLCEGEYAGGAAACVL